jgi:hypothetical protein
MFKKISLALAASVLVSTAPAAAPVTTPTLSTTFGCSASDLTGISTVGFACSGFYSGNILNASNYSGIGTILENLTGQSWTQQQIIDSFASKIELNGGHVVDFAGVFTGPTVVAIHKGRGNGSDGVRYNGTSFYYFDAGTSLNSIGYTLNGSSNAVAFDVPNITNAVPEPSTYALFLTGLGVIGYVGSRRRKS